MEHRDEEAKSEGGNTDELYRSLRESFSPDKLPWRAVDKSYVKESVESIKNI